MAHGYSARTGDFYDSQGNIRNDADGKFVSDEVTLQNGVSAPENGTVIYMGGADTFKITEISGTAATRTIIFEVSNKENGTYSLIQGVRLSDTTLNTQSTTNNEIWQFDGVAGLWFRARISEVSGGNVTVKGKKVA